MTLLERFEQVAGRRTFAAEDLTDTMLDLMADLVRAHATNLGVAGVAPVGSILLACPRCGGRVLAAAEGEHATCAAGCNWRGTVAEACR